MRQIIHQRAHLISRFHISFMNVFYFSVRNKQSNVKCKITKESFLGRSVLFFSQKQTFLLDFFQTYKVYNIHTKNLERCITYIPKTYIPYMEFYIIYTLYMIYTFHMVYTLYMINTFYMVNTLYIYSLYIVYIPYIDCFGLGNVLGDELFFQKFIKLWLKLLPKLIRQLFYSLIIFSVFFSEFRWK